MLMNNMNNIKMYGTQWCGDCMRVKQVFSRLKIAYDWIDIEKDADACAYVEKVNGGYKSVPTILFPDGSTLVEPSNATLQQKLDSLK
jgi:glutaredoxin-like protein